MRLAVFVHYGYAWIMSKMFGRDVEEPTSQETPHRIASRGMPGMPRRERRATRHPTTNSWKASERGRSTDH